MSLRERKRYEWIKSTLEETNILIVGRLDLKNPEDKEIYDALCQAINKSDEMANRYQIAYEENS